MQPLQVAPWRAMLLAGSLASVLQHGACHAGPSSRPQAVVTTAPQLQLPAILPKQVANQIRWAQQKAALSGQAPPAWAIGAPCIARHSDGEQYPAKITGVTATGSFVVQFPNYELEEEVRCCQSAPSCEACWWAAPMHTCMHACLNKGKICSLHARNLACLDKQEGVWQVAVEQVKPPPEQPEVYQGVIAPKRKRVDEGTEIGEMPKVCLCRLALQHARSGASCTDSASSCPKAFTHELLQGAVSSALN